MVPMNQIRRNLLIPTVVILALASPTAVQTQNKKGSQIDDVSPAADRNLTRFTVQNPPSDLIPPYPSSDFIERLTVDAHRVSIDPGDYQLTSFHLNAETHFQNAPSELGWSMRHLGIVVISCDGD